MPAHDACPVCRSSKLYPVLHWPDVPSNSSLFLATASEARAHPRGSYRLVGCDSCGLLFNADVDEALIEYSGRSLETQAASGRFNEFARELARDWVERWDLHGKTALEIGCGRTPTFLELFCDLSGGPGIGFDPVLDTSASTGLRLIPERFESAATEVDADAVVCRHTLEHVVDVAAFLGALNTWTQKRKQAVLLFEVPDVSRVLREDAIWDLYYEHSSYFSACSLRSAFSLAGFDVNQVTTAYDGQYLLLEATLGDGAPQQGHQQCGRDMRALASGFAQRAARATDRARQSIVALSADGPLVLWQAGSKAVGLLTATGAESCVTALVDANPQKHGLFLVGSGLPVVAAAELRAIAPRHVVVMNEIYADEIRATLDAEGVDARLHTANDLLGLDEGPAIDASAG